jgi:hypothetical protein
MSSTKNKDGEPETISKNGARPAKPSEQDEFKTYYYV